jgi:formylglycine-generating enzyme required for sulfatase activity
MTLCIPSWRPRWPTRLAARAFAELIPLSLIAALNAPAGALAADPGAKPATALAAQGKNPSAPWRDCEAVHCPWLVTVPAGSFTMGSPASEPERGDDEGPQRRVTLPSFAIGRHEVSFAQWDACVADGGCTAQPRDEGWGRADRPVIRVRWEMAGEYLAWLGRKTGQRYRLPSEAEWEYAARAGTTTPFSLGERVDPDQVNVAGGFAYNGSRKGVDRQRTVPVGSLPANPWGLHEVHGNVWEWVEDCWHDDYRGAPRDARAWTRNCSEPRHVLRGGSWYDRVDFARSAFRHGLEAGSHTAIGFRVVRELRR